LFFICLVVGKGEEYLLYKGEFVQKINELNHLKRQLLNKNSTDIPGLKTKLKIDSDRMLDNLNEMQMLDGGNIVFSN